MKEENELEPLVVLKWQAEVADAHSVETEHQQELKIPQWQPNQAGSWSMGKPVKSRLRVL